MLKLERTLRKLLKKIELMKTATQTKNEIVICDDSVQEIIDNSYTDIGRRVMMKYYNRI